MNENQIQQQVATLRALQVNAGIPATQWARNVLPMRKLVRLAIMSAKARTIIDGKPFLGLTLQEIIKWLTDNGFGANYGTVAVTLSTLRKQKIIDGGYINRSPVYLWTENP